MRYKPDHKEATRNRIRTAAAELFRKHGYEATGVDTIMAEAGLTPGGFYSHFASKEALLLETLSNCLVERAATIAQTAKTSSDPLTAMVHRYLCALHRDNPGSGCPLPNLAAEVSRLAPGARKEFTEALERYLAGVESFIPGANLSERRKDAIATLSTLVGAMALARAVADGNLSEEILESARDVLLATQRARSSPSKRARKASRRR